MNFNLSQIQVAKRLAVFASVYQNAYINNMSFRKQFENGYIALECFLKNYAYERKVSVQAYPIIAKQTIEKVFHGKLETVNSNQPTEAWKIYKDIATRGFNGIETNESHNPMNEDQGVLTVMAKEGIENIAGYVKKLIHEGNTKKAHEFIDNIRGIGPKIASFYLRDVAYLGGLDENKIKDQFYLQPLDTWLEQTYTIIIEGKKTANREEKQKAFVELCGQAGCSPIAFNQGAWIVGSQIAGEYSTFQKIAFGKAESKEIIKNYVEEERAYARALSEIEKLIDN